ncbi:MAG TPA: branched-chain amino acid ABC transporter permease, partial [Anaerolineaceae bacterium]|nr:branched-chain amino acid ABC transporter permease [Anaerolineaceae bacterium]
MTTFLQQTLNALQLGSIYALIALGYTMVYGILTMINFAHGDLFMIGAFFCFLGATFLNLPFIPSLLLSMVGVAMLGVTIERVAYRPLRSAPRVSAIITALGVGIFLENFTLVFFPYPQSVPTLLKTVIWNIGGVTISNLQILIIVVAILMMIMLDVIVQKTKVG